MFDRCFKTVYRFVANRKRIFVIALPLLVLAAAAGLRYVSFENNIELMLPGNKDVFRSMEFLRSADFSDKVVLSFRLNQAERDGAELIAAVDDFAGKLSPPMVTDVITGPGSGRMMQDIVNLLDYIPQLAGKERLLQIEGLISETGAGYQLKRIYGKLIGPGSSFLMPFIRRDPLNIASSTLKSLKGLSSSLGYDVRIENGHFVSADGRNAMLIAETSVIITDAPGSKKLLAYLNEQLEELPEYISVDIIAGHRHTLSNEEVIKRDIGITMAVASVAFLVLFLFIFRDMKAVVILILPMAAVLFSINLSFLILGRLSYFIIGMGTVVMGIAVDYGVHVFTAVRSGGNVQANVGKVAKPVVVGALTTITVFSAFFFSSVQGYHQLAYFSVISIVLCVIFSLFLLPHIIGAGRRRPAAKSGKEGPTSDKRSVVIWSVVMLVAVTLSAKSSFDSDIIQFDGSDKDILRAEKEFNETWGGADKPAIFVVPGSTLEEALENNEEVYVEAAEKIGSGKISTISAVWPSAKTRRKNKADWNSFWADGRAGKLKKYFSMSGRKYNFSEKAFSPFFESMTYTDEVEEGFPATGLFEGLKERFTVEKDDRWQVLSFFKDIPENTAVFKQISENHPGAFLVSRNALSGIISGHISGEIMYLSVIAVLLVSVITIILLGSVKLAAIAMVPSLTSVAGTLAVLALIGRPINVAAVIAALVVIGLCNDYGIFTVYSHRTGMQAGTRKAIFLCALTTVIGSSVLMFARHPVLFSVGFTLTVGIIAGYASSAMVVPAMCRLWVKRS